MTTFTRCGGIEYPRWQQGESLLGKGRRQPLLGSFAYNLIRWFQSVNVGCWWNTVKLDLYLEACFRSYYNWQPFLDSWNLFGSRVKIVHSSQSIRHCSEMRSGIEWIRGWAIKPCCWLSKFGIISKSESLTSQKSLENQSTLAPTFLSCSYAVRAYARRNFITSGND